MIMLLLTNKIYLKSVSGAHNNDDDSPQLIVHTASADNIVTVQILSSYQLLISLMKT